MTIFLITIGIIVGITGLLLKTPSLGVLAIVCLTLGTYNIVEAQLKRNNVKKQEARVQKERRSNGRYQL